MIDRGDSATAAAYDVVADSYADHFSSTEPEQALDLAVIDHFVHLMPVPRRTLDAGCGAGRMLPYLATRGCLVDGIDVSGQMIRRARRDHPHFPVGVASLLDLPFADAVFDGVLSWYSIIHTPDGEIPRLLAEMRRVLRSSGLVLLGFQTGAGERDVSPSYRRLGHDITLVRYARPVTWMTEQLLGADFIPVVTVERAPAGAERDGQGFIIARPR